MLTVEGIFDGKKIEMSEEIPFKTKRKVLITFFDDDVCKTDMESETDPIKALRGCSKNINLTGKLLESRREDSELEEPEWKR